MEEAAQQPSLVSPKSKRKGRSKDEEGTSSPLGSRRSTLKLTRPRKSSRQPKELLFPDAESEEEILKTWGITIDTEEKILNEFKEQIEAEVGPLPPFFDYYYLRRFLRARQHDIPRAKEMFLAHLKWREEFGIDTIEEFHFHERDAFLTVYPQGYHKTDKLGRPIYIQHLGSINLKALYEVTNEERMVRFHVQEYERALKYIFPACSKVAGRHIGQTLAIMDVKGVGVRHLTGEVRRVLGAITSIDQNNYPETLGKTLIINAPTLFKAVWAIVKPMLDVRTQAKIEVCSTDYMPKLLRWVDMDSIPEYLGGTSKGSLIDDVGPWLEPQIISEIDADIAKRDAGLVVGHSSTTTSVSVKASGVPPSPFESSSFASEATRAGGVGSSLKAPTTRTTMVTTTSSETWEVEVASPSDLAALAGGTSSTGPTVTRLPDSGANGTASFGSQQQPFSYKDENGEDVFYDALTRRLSVTSTTSSAYMSADEGDEQYFSDEPPSPMSIPTPQASIGDDGKWDTAQAQMQIPILARIRALEERLPDVERGVSSYLPPQSPSASAAVGQGTLQGRVVALEKAMDALLRAQTVAMGDKKASKKKSRCGCCTVM